MTEPTPPLDAITQPPDDERAGEARRAAPPAPKEELAFEELYLQLAPLLRVLARRRFRVPPEDAGALVNDVFINYLRDPMRIHDPRQYLVGATCHASRAYWRRRVAHDGMFRPGDVPDGTEDPTFESLATTLAVGTMLSQVGTNCRDVLQRFYVDDQPAAAIAEELETSPGAIRVRLHKCRQKARKIFHAITRPLRPHAP
jgi:RNA polymerase sigma factor (sigma-70 family)